MTRTRTPAAETRTGPRSGHPYFMYEHIREQPDAMRDALKRNRARILKFARDLRGREPVLLSGTGSSLHAAQLGEHWLRTIAGVSSAHAVESFELANYFPPPQPGSALIEISHRGRGQPAIVPGVLTAAISGAGGRFVKGSAVTRFITTSLEQSEAHTKSLTSALAVLLEIAIQSATAACRSDSANLARRELREIPARLLRRVQDDSQERNAADRFKEIQRIVLLGGGPNAVAAQEGALKLKETSFTYAEGFSVEEFLNGPIASADDRTLAILISAGGAAAVRVEQAARGLREIGAKLLAVATDAGANLTRTTDASIRVEGHEEITGAFGVILSLQLFAYYSALVRGCAPDHNRREDSRYARAAAYYQK